MSEINEGLDMLRSVLAPFFTGYAARYGHPVYLVGSALRIQSYDEVWKLRDIDISIVLPDEEFRSRFGGDWPATEGWGEPSSRWAAECGKLARQATQHFQDMNFDIKVMSESWQKARSANKPRLRIDHAGFGETGA